MRFPDDFVAKSSLQDFDLLQNTSLWCLQISAASLSAALQSGNGSQLLKYVLSTVRPSIFFRLVVTYETSTFHGADNLRDSEWPYLTSCHDLWQRRKRRNTADDSSCYVSSTECGTLICSCVRTFGILSGNTRCEG